MTFDLILYSSMYIHEPQGNDDEVWGVTAQLQHKT